MNPDPRPGPSAPSTSQRLDRVCTALLPAARSDQPPAVLPNDPVGTRGRCADHLERRAATLGSAVDGINAAGPAPVEGGQRVTESVTAQLRSQAETATSLRDLALTPPLTGEVPEVASCRSVGTG